MVGLSRVLRVLRTRFFIIFLVDFPSRGIGKIKGEFRVLRDAASLRGWIAPGRRPGPAYRLRAGVYSLCGAYSLTGLPLLSFGPSGSSDRAIRLS